MFGLQRKCHCLDCQHLRLPPGWSVNLPLGARCALDGAKPHRKNGKLDCPQFETNPSVIRQACAAIRQWLTGSATQGGTHG